MGAVTGTDSQGHPGSRRSRGVSRTGSWRVSGTPRRAVWGASGEECRWVALAFCCMKIQADRRVLETSNGEEGMARLSRGAALIREGEILAAQGLLEVHRSKSYARHGHASAVDYASVAHGIDQGRARELLRMALVMQLLPEIEEQLRRGELTAQVAGEVGKLAQFQQRRPEAMSRDELVQCSREALGIARGRRRHATRDFVRSRTEEAAQGERVIPLTVNVTEKTHEDFHRCRVLAERSARRTLTLGETFTLVTGYYLAHEDAMRKDRRERRAPPTSERPGDRYVPADVERRLLERSGDRCEYGTCSNRVFLANAHHHPHAAGGDRELGNLERLCSAHHLLKDAGAIARIAMNARGPTYRVIATGEVVPPRDRGEPRAGDAGITGPPERAQGPPGSADGSEDEPPSSAPCVREAATDYGVPAGADACARRGRHSRQACHRGGSSRRRPS